eukprot:COSAG01_NODE_12685_length_1700_cov_1.673329_3_plen_233_part_00
METSPLRYSNVFKSDVPRFDAKYYGASSCKTEVYDINQGHKSSLSTGVEKSPMLLSHMKPGRPRMTYAKPDTREEINTNVAHKKAMVEMLPDLAVNYSVMRSDTKRFSGKGQQKPLDVVYNIDSGHKVSLGTGVAQSRQSYPVFRSAAERFGKVRLRLGLGSYSAAPFWRGEGMLGCVLCSRGPRTQLCACQHRTAVHWVGLMRLRYARHGDEKCVLPADVAHVAGAYRAPS